MREAKRCLQLFGVLDNTQYSYKPEIAVFADGKLYQRQGLAHPSCQCQTEIRNSLGNSGLAFDLYILDDFEKRYKDYKAIIFPSAISSTEIERAKELCQKAGIAVLCATMEKWKFTPEELRDFAKSANVHIFSDSNDVICYGNSLLSIHTATAGEKMIKLPKTTIVKNICSNKDEFTSDEIILSMKKHQTIIFSLRDK
jgi:hypothetical protein